METTTKLCHACKITKPAKDFYKSSNSKDGLAPSCKDCQNGKTGATPVPKQTVVPGAYAKSMRKTINLENKPKRATDVPLVEETIRTPTNIYFIPTEEDHLARRLDKGKTWKQVYGKTCVVCLKKFEPEQPYSYCKDGFRHVDCQEV